RRYVNGCAGGGILHPQLEEVAPANDDEVMSVAELGKTAVEEALLPEKLPYFDLGIFERLRQSLRQHGAKAGVVGIIANIADKAAKVGNLQHGPLPYCFRNISAMVKSSAVSMSMERSVSMT